MINRPKIEPRILHCVAIHYCCRIDSSSSSISVSIALHGIHVKVKTSDQCIKMNCTIYIKKKKKKRNNAHKTKITSQLHEIPKSFVIAVHATDTKYWVMIKNMKHVRTEKQPNRIISAGIQCTHSHTTLFQSPSFFIFLFLIFHFFLLLLRSLFIFC